MNNNHAYGPLIEYLDLSYQEKQLMKRWIFAVGDPLRSQREVVAARVRILGFIAELGRLETGNKKGLAGLIQNFADAEWKRGMTD